MSNIGIVNSRARQRKSGFSRQRLKFSKCKFPSFVQIKLGAQRYPFIMWMKCTHKKLPGNLPAR